MKKKELKNVEISMLVESKAYLPFAEGERIVDITIKEKNIEAKVSVVENFAEIGNIKTTTENLVLSLGNIKTACLIIEVSKPTEIEALILK